MNTSKKVGNILADVKAKIVLYTEKCVTSFFFNAQCMYLNKQKSKNFIIERTGCRDRQLLKMQWYDVLKSDRVILRNLTTVTGYY